MRWLWFVGAILLLASLAGCGNSAQDRTTALEPGHEAVDSSESGSPIADFFGFDFNDPDSMRAAQQQVETDAGLLAQTCMLEQGFEFIPPRSNGVGALGPSGSDLAPNSDEWVAKYGFGVSTLYLPQSMVGDLVGIPESEARITGVVIDELNRDYTESLSAVERDAYDVALRGSQSESGDSRGCIGQALEYIATVGPDVQGFFGAFGDDLQEMQVRTAADPVVVDFYATVSNCVADEGLSFVTVDEFVTEMSAKLAALSAYVEEDNQGGRALSPAGFERFAELQAEELATAQVVLACGGGPTDTEQALGSVIAGYEREFLAQNADALTEFLAE